MKAPMEEALTNCVHDLFLHNDYRKWRQALKTFSPGAWHSLVASLAKHQVPATAFLAFAEDVYSKLVFNYIQAPDYDESQMLMVHFTVAGSMWSCLVWHCPERG